MSKRKTKKKVKHMRGYTVIFFVVLSLISFGGYKTYNQWHKLQPLPTATVEATPAEVVPANDEVVVTPNVEVPVGNNEPIVVPEPTADAVNHQWALSHGIYGSK